MAKLQQMNEMSKQNSQILLQDGYVTYEGKRYNDCNATEKEAFNKALNQELHPNNTTRVSDKMFNKIIEQLKPDGNKEKWGLSYTSNYYEFLLYGDETGTYSDSSRFVKGNWLAIEFTDEQWVIINALLDIERQVQETIYKEREMAEYYKTERALAYNRKMDKETCDWYC